MDHITVKALAGLALIVAAIALGVKFAAPNEVTEYDRITDLQTGLAYCSQDDTPEREHCAYWVLTEYAPHVVGK